MTDGLFRETVRAIPRQEAPLFDEVTVAEQIVDSAVYRCVYRQLGTDWAITYTTNMS